MKGWIIPTTRPPKPRRGARSMIAADVLEGILDLSSRMDVTDEQGATLFTIPFASAVRQV